MNIQEIQEQAIKDGNVTLQNVCAIHESIAKYGATEQLKDLVGEVPFELNCAAIEAFIPSIGTDAKVYRPKFSTSIPITNRQVTTQIYCDEKTALPTKEALNAFAFTTKNADKIFAKEVIPGLVKYYNETVSMDYKQNLPEQLTEADILDHIQVKVFIFGAKRKSKTLYFLCGECDWDDEHGWSLGLEKDKVVSAGLFDMAL